MYACMNLKIHVLVTRELQQHSHMFPRTVVGFCTRVLSLIITGVVPRMLYEPIHYFSKSISHSLAYEKSPADPSQTSAPSWPRGTQGSGLLLPILVVSQVFCWCATWDGLRRWVYFFHCVLKDMKLFDPMHSGARLFALLPRNLLFLVYFFDETLLLLVRTDGEAAWATVSSPWGLVVKDHTLDSIQCMYRDGSVLDILETISEKRSNSYLMAEDYVTDRINCD